MHSEDYKLEGVEVIGTNLGTDAYADNIEVRYKGLTCTAKKFHFTKDCSCTTLLKEYESRCLQHCEVLGRLRHPNIVQFLGFYYEGPDSIVPMLIYESPYICLSDCLSTYGKLPESISYSIFKDVAIALRYLHECTPPIVHRSLSANKVMLSRDMSAKLTDVGILSITDSKPMGGTEDCKDNRVPLKMTYRRSLDIEVKNDVYAFGLLLLHVITCKDILSDLTSTGLFIMDTSISFDDSEVIHSYISEIWDHHPLLQITEKCLNINANLRPSTITLSAKVSQVSANHPPEFFNSLDMLKKIKNDSENQSIMKAELRKLSPQCSYVEAPGPKTQKNEIDTLRELVSKVSAQNLALQARVVGKRGSISAKNEEMFIHSKQLKRQSNHSINSPLDVSILYYCTLILS